MGAFPFPLSLNRRFPETPGFLVKIPSCYQKALHGPIERFLSSLPYEERLFEDPNGFTAMPFYFLGQWSVICCVRVEGYFSRKKTKPVIGTDFNPVFPLEAFIDLISKFRSLPNQHRDTGAAGGLVSKPESHEFVMVTMHEIRRLNLQIKAQAEEIMQDISRVYNHDFVNERSQNIFATSSLISIRLDTYDFHLNPKAFTAEQPKAISIYRKFEKATHCVKVLSQREKLQIRFIGQSFRLVSGYDLFEVLPFVLIENAIKYSPPKQEIVIRMTPTVTTLSICIESVGPMLLPNEQDHVFEQNFRGANAKKVKLGTGTGLHFAKLVCDLHKIKIAAVSDQKERFSLNGVPYSLFEVRLSVPTIGERR